MFKIFLTKFRPAIIKFGKVKTHKGRKVKGLHVGSRRISQKGKVIYLPAIYCELRNKNSVLWRKGPLSLKDAPMLVSIDFVWQAHPRERCPHRLLLSSQIQRHPNWSTENPVPSGINVIKDPWVIGLQSLPLYPGWGKWNLFAETFYLLTCSVNLIWDRLTNVLSSYLLLLEWTTAVLNYSLI